LRAGEGVSFTNIAGGLKAEDGAYLKAFASLFFFFPFVALNQLFFIRFVLGWSRFLGFDIFDSTSSTSIGPFKLLHRTGNGCFGDTLPLVRKELGPRRRDEDWVGLVSLWRSSFSLSFVSCF